MICKNKIRLQLERSKTRQRNINTNTFGFMDFLCPGRLAQDSVSALSVLSLRMARADGKHFCFCGKKKLSNLSPLLQQTRSASESEILLCAFDSGNLACFRFRKDCHKQRWP